MGAILTIIQLLISMPIINILAVYKAHILHNHVLHP